MTAVSSWPSPFPPLWPPSWTSSRPCPQAFRPSSTRKRCWNLPLESCRFLSSAWAGSSPRASGLQSDWHCTPCVPRLSSEYSKKRPHPSAANGSEWGRFAVQSRSQLTRNARIPKRSMQRAKADLGFRGKRPSTRTFCGSAPFDRHYKASPGGVLPGQSPSLGCQGCWERCRQDVLKHHAFLSPQLSCGSPGDFSWSSVREKLSINVSRK